MTARTRPSPAHRRRRCQREAIPGELGQPIDQTAEAWIVRKRQRLLHVGEGRALHQLAEGSEAEVGLLRLAGCLVLAFDGRCSSPQVAALRVVPVLSIWRATARRVAAATIDRVRTYRRVSSRFSLEGRPRALMLRRSHQPGGFRRGGSRGVEWLRSMVHLGRLDRPAPPPVTGVTSGSPPRPPAGSRRH